MPGSYICHNRAVTTDADADFPARMRRARKAAGISQGRLAAALGCDIMTISRLERDPDLWQRSRFTGAVERVLNMHLTGERAGRPIQVADTSHLSTRELAEGLARSLESDDNVRATARVALSRLVKGDFAGDAERDALADEVDAALTGSGSRPEWVEVSGTDFAAFGMADEGSGDEAPPSGESAQA